jgi:hypothetical protein
VRGFESEPLTRETVGPAARRAFEYACAQWPAVVERQLHPLVLVNSRGEPEP